MKADAAKTVAASKQTKKETAAEPTMQQRVWREAISWFWVILAFLFIEGTLVQARVIPSGSMENTVLIGAPHTSNWDFVFMLGIAWKLGMNFRWLGKNSLFRGWRGPIMRALGGIPVHRADPARVVGAADDALVVENGDGSTRRLSQAELDALFAADDEGQRRGA